MKLISPSILRTVLRYDAESGKLYWRARSSDLFSNNARRTAAHSCAAWNSRCANREAFRYSFKRGLQGTLFGKTYYAHRVAWAIHHGAWPDGEIDHINSDPTYNRLVNLRDVTHTENCRNVALSSANTSGVIGVSFHRRRGMWRADIKVNQRSRHLGYFHVKDDAIAARKRAERDAGFHQNHGRTA